MENLKNELYDFYLNKIDAMADAFGEKMFAVLDSLVTPDMNGYQRKALQYKTIAEYAEPVLFRNSPFYHELGTMIAVCDGCGSFHGHRHAGGWNFARYNHLYSELAPELMKLKNKQAENLLYLICGPFSDCMQHFMFNCKPVFSGGLKSLYDTASEQAKNVTGIEKDFLEAVQAGLLAMKRISQKFADKASEMAESSDGEERKNLLRIADSALYTPWNAPRTFYEALNILAFTRTVSGALEGVGYNTFGRPDVTLLPFYTRDIENGVLTKGEAYDLICKFLLTWDLHYDHDMKMVGYADHELENTYTLGGCDENGKPVWNELTEMFLRATREHKVIFPKIKVRFGADSPKEYLDAINESVIKGTTVVLYQNDDASVPALVNAGFSLSDARDYLVTGCWGLMTNGNFMDDHGNYVNLLKAFEYSVHDMKDKDEYVEIDFKPFDDAKSFDEVYDITLENCKKLFSARDRITLEGKPLWHTIDPVPLTSASMVDCLANKKDLTNGGCKYHNEHYQCVGFPNIIDSLLAIKTLCFDEKKYSLKKLLHAVRNNWENEDIMRADAMHCHCWGDESTESSALAQRFNHDLYTALGELETLWDGGRIDLGHLTYTEIRFWGEQTLATPDGRKNGDYFSQGLTPSRLHKIPNVTSVVNSLKALDAREMGGNAVVNIILPSTRMTLDNCEAFLRACANTSMMSLQLNCVTKEELLDAQKHPEEHQDLIVRVCGFSARFTSLSPEWQAEVLSRNFYD